MCRSKAVSSSSSRLKEDQSPSRSVALQVPGVCRRRVFSSQTSLHRVFFLFISFLSLPPFFSFIASVGGSSRCRSRRARLFPELQTPEPVLRCCSRPPILFRVSSSCLALSILPRPILPRPVLPRSDLPRLVLPLPCLASACLPCLVDS